MSLANQERRQSGSARLTPQHLLLGLIIEDKGVATNALRRLKPDLEAMKAALAAGIASEAALQPPVPVEVAPPRTASERIFRAIRNWAASRKMPLATQTERIIEQALREARELRHNYVGTEHLLLGLLDEPENAAGRLLFAHGLKSDDVRREVLDILGRGNGADG